MAELEMLDRTYDAINRRFIETGQAPHYTELAKELGVSTEQARQLLHDLMESGIPAWLHPGTDYIASFAPFNNLPTHYRISVDGEQRWFAQ